MEPYNNEQVLEEEQLISRFNRFMRSDEILKANDGKRVLLIKDFISQINDEYILNSNLLHVEGVCNAYFKNNTLRDKFVKFIKELDVDKKYLIRVFNKYIGWS